MKPRSNREPVLKFACPGLILITQFMLFSHAVCFPYDKHFTKVDATTSTPTCTETSCRNIAEIPETLCNNTDGWNLKGSEWGCCGNYGGCCTYASFLCYLHDAMCRCCSTKLCGPDCRPESDCADDDVEDITEVSNANNQYAEMKKKETDQMSKSEDKGEKKTAASDTDGFHADKKTIEKRNKSESTDDSIEAERATSVVTDNGGEKTAVSDKDKQYADKRENDKESKGDKTYDGVMAERATVTAVDTNNSFREKLSNVTQRENFVSFHYQRDQSVHSTDKRVFGKSGDSVEEGSGDAEEKVTL